MTDHPKLWVYYASPSSPTLSEVSRSRHCHFGGQPEQWAREHVHLTLTAAMGYRRASVESARSRGLDTGHGGLFSEVAVECLLDGGMCLVRHTGRLAIVGSDGATVDEIDSNHGSEP
jgi:hypothetical protein